MIFYHYLIIKKWTPKFIPFFAKISKVWVQLLELPMLYYNGDVLKAIASRIGCPVKIDTNTSLVIEGRFARIYVEINLNKPLVGQFTLDGQKYKVEYKGLHTICFTCDIIGHNSEGCPITIV